VGIVERLVPEVFLPPPADILVGAVNFDRRISQ
jgi:hypothetical protein